MAEFAYTSSWVPGADGSQFPIQNLPYGIFSHARSGRSARPGVAIGDAVLDLCELSNAGLLDEHEGSVQAAVDDWLAGEAAGTAVRDAKARTARAVTDFYAIEQPWLVRRSRTAPARAVARSFESCATRTPAGPGPDSRWWRS